MRACRQTFLIFPIFAGRQKSGGGGRKYQWINSSAPQTVGESTLGYYVDLRFVGIEWG